MIFLRSPPRPSTSISFLGRNSQAQMASKPVLALCLHVFLGASFLFQQASSQTGNFQCAIVNTGPTYKPFTALACDANCTRLAAAQQNLLLTSSDSGSSYDDRGWPPYAEDSSQPLWPTFNATTNVAAMCSSKDGKYLLAATNGPEEPLYPGSGLYNYGHLFSSQDYGVTWKSLGTVGNYGAYSSCAVSDGKQSSWYARSCGETRD